jgi:hypothetical protein
MGRSAASDCPVEAARHNGISRRSANADLRTIAKGINATGSLQAVAATQASLAEAALGQLGGIPVPYKFSAKFLSDAEHFDGIGRNGTIFEHGDSFLRFG